MKFADIYLWTNCRLCVVADHRFMRSLWAIQTASGRTSSCFGRSLINTSVTTAALAYCGSSAKEPHKRGECDVWCVGAALPSLQLGNCCVFRYSLCTLASWSSALSFLLWCSFCGLVLLFSVCFQWRRTAVSCRGDCPLKGKAADRSSVVLVDFFPGRTKRSIDGRAWRCRSGA